MEADHSLVLFSPEYSTELSKRIKDIYKYDIKHYYPQLKLEKLIDLLEHTQYLFELYTHFINNNNNKDALTSYIIGCFYVFLIMPHSIQFQAKNKDFSIYTDMKKFYESQMTMTNVLLMVKDEIENMLDDTTSDSIEMNQFIARNRAFSVPHDALTETLDSLTLDSKGKNDESESGSSISTERDDVYLNPLTGALGEHQLNSDNEIFSEELDSTFPIWTAPSLEPNDQLKLALLPESIPLPTLPLREDFSEPIELPIYPNEETFNNVTGKQPIVRERNESVAMSMFERPTMDNSSSSPYTNINEDNIRNSTDLIADRSLTHRKNSYHSVYMMENENDEIRNDKYYDKSNDFIRRLERLERQSIITSPELFSILTNKTERGKLLLIDLRLERRCKYNNILAQNYVEIDPNLLWDTEKNSPIYDIKELENLVSNDTFNNRNSYEYIVYYSDMKTYMKLNFDYHFILFYLLTTSIKETDKLKGAPTALLGGYEKWKKMLHNYVKEYGIDARDFICGPYDSNGDKISKSSSSYISHTDESRATKTMTTGGNIPEPPSWNPPDVPIIIRKRPPPPPPTVSPKAPPIPIGVHTRAPPQLPPKIKINFERVNTLVRVPSSVPAVPSNIPRKTLPCRLNNIIENRVAAPKPKSYSIPTIERSSNVYVSLSITGLRNLGNTCYINSMVQCLFSTKIFRDLFLSNEFENYLDLNNKSLGPNIGGLSLARSFNILFKKMYLNGGCSVVPIAFLKTSNILRPDLRIPDDQQDTQEFLMLILDRLHDELSKQDEIVNEYPNLLLYDADNLKVNRKEYKKWYDSNIIANGFSPIDDIFQGQMESCLQCQRCGYSTYNYSGFYVLSLAIPKKPKSLNSTFSRSSKRVNLEDCITMYTSDEVLTGGNAWNCPKCCQERKDRILMKKKLKVQQPQYLQTPTPHQNQNQHHSRSLEKHSIFKFGGSKEKKQNSFSRSLSPFRLIKKNDTRESSKDIEQSFYNGAKDGNSYKRASSEVEVDTALYNEHDDEKLREWKNKKLITIKTLNFISLPKILVIHLSRFYYDLTKKNSTIITYPLLLNIALKNNKINKFKLYGIVNHTGNLISGHYTSLINKDYEHSLKTGEQKWYYFDDEVVKQENNHGNIDRGIDKVSSKDAYVLFYERVK